LKAMILAAGKGTRLLPLTKNLPKCLMSLAGRPLIDWQLSWLKKHGVTECVINLHYLPDQVRTYCRDGAYYGLRVEYSFEPELLGTAGAVKKVADFFDSPFLVIYGDNFSQWNLKRLEACFEQPDSAAAPLAVMAVHWREDVTHSGMVETDAADRILRYVEKPTADAVTSHWANAGFYFLHPTVLNYIPAGEFCDFSYHVFPAMLQADEALYVAKMDQPIIGIDTLEAYRHADALARRLSKHETGASSDLCETRCTSAEAERSS
jgi:mannose-1-phosphate guanylyltransferase